MSGLFTLICLPGYSDPKSSLEKFPPDPLGEPQEWEMGSFTRPIQWFVDTTRSSLLFRTGHTAVHDVVGWGHSLPGFVVEGKFSRFDFGLNSQDKMRASNVPMVDDTIYITGNFRLYFN